MNSRFFLEAVIDLPVRTKSVFLYLTFSVRLRLDNVKVQKENCSGYTSKIPTKIVPRFTEQRANSRPLRIIFLTFEIAGKQATWNRIFEVGFEFTTARDGV